MFGLQTSQNHSWWIFCLFIYVCFTDAIQARMEAVNFQPVRSANCSNLKGGNKDNKAQHRLYMTHTGQMCKKIDISSVKIVRYELPSTRKANSAYIDLTIFAPPASSRRRRPGCFSRLTASRTRQSLKAPTATRDGAPSSCCAKRASCSSRRQRRAASSMASGFPLWCSCPPHS